MTTTMTTTRADPAAGLMLRERQDLVTAVGGIAPPSAKERDLIGDERDKAAEQRDHAAEQRDHAAEQRDHAAEQRDQVAERSARSRDAETPTDTLARSALARQEAASDRRVASEDRRAGAIERTQAELDRRAAASERDHACVDDLTGVYLRGPGLAELNVEVARVRQAQHPLVLAFVDVNRLKTTNRSRGRAAGDRLLVEVAETLRGELRSYDLIIRYADDEFVCAFPGLSMAGAKKRLAFVKAALADAPEHGSITVGLAELQPDESAEDLVARADAVLNRERQRPSNHAPTHVLECGEIVVDEGARMVTRAGSPIPLTAIEFKMLGVLVRNRTRVVPKIQLLGEVWGYDANDHLLEVHISSLRRKLEAHGPRLVQTVRGIGYVLRA